MNLPNMACGINQYLTKFCVKWPSFGIQKVHGLRNHSTDFNSMGITSL